jgi:hypothetical protein
VRQEGLGKLKKSSDLIGTRIFCLLAYSIVPQLLLYRVPRPLGTSATIWHIILAPDDNEYGVIGGMIVEEGNRSTRRKPAPVPL